MPGSPRGTRTGGRAEPSDQPHPHDQQRAAHVEHSILTLVLEHVEASLREAPTLSAVELLESFQRAARKQLAEVTKLKAREHAD